MEKAEKDIEIFKKVLDEMGIPYKKAKPNVLCTINGKDICSENELKEVVKEIFTSEFVERYYK